MTPQNQNLLSRSQGSARTGFTLIELLVVIAVIAILAALIFPVIGALKRIRVQSRARAELAQVEMAIAAYKAKLGFYPPDNGNNKVPATYNPATNQLFYELIGTMLTNNSTTFVTKDGATQILQSALPLNFGTAGFMNCSRGGGDDNTASAVTFLRGLKAGQSLLAQNGIMVLGSSLDGPIMVLGNNGTKINPWRYNSSNPTNNPGSYDLWIDVMVGSVTNRICNWNAKPLLNQPPP
jgi:prepilin-type N-terminal cleavage/methylation domain-containing protein